MKHAGRDALEALEELLVEIRTVPGLTERSPGVFHRAGRAFLHFHEDPAGVFADLRVAGEWQRLRSTTRREQAALLAATRRAARGA